MNQDRQSKVATSLVEFNAIAAIAFNETPVKVHEIISRSSP